MRDYPILDYIAASEAKASAIDLVMENEREEWRQLYRELAERFLSSLSPGDLFTLEEIRLDLISFRDMPPPHHPNVWSAMAGSVLKTWRASGRIALEGQRRQLEARHGRLYPQYRVV